MTNEELISKLQQYPPDLPVFIQCDFEDFEFVEAQSIEYDKDMLHWNEDTRVEELIDCLKICYI